MKKITTKIYLFILFVFVLTQPVAAQTTAFTYQGRFTDSSQAQPTNGTYQMQFALFDAASAPVGAAITVASVSVVNGIFTVQLDFGAPAFPANMERLLEIRVFNTTTAVYVALSPRQPLMSAPFAIRSKTATTADVSTDTLQVGGTPAAQIIKEGDARLTDTRTPTAGSGNYIQNQNAAAQTSSNFNISGTGAANVFNATTQYNIGGSRVLSVGGTNNLFAGVAGGAANTTGSFNSFVGANAGLRNTTGSVNSFFGGDAGQANTTGNNNSFVGFNAGYSNTTGGDNSFVGRNAGFSNTGGNFNSFVGREAGFSNTTGGSNSFFGFNAGFSNTTGRNNSFFGRDAGYSNTTGEFNSFAGSSAGSSNTTGDFNSFVGNGAGQFNTTGNLNSFIGTGAGFSNTTGGSNSFIGADAGRLNTTGGSNSFLSVNAGFNNTTGGFSSFVGSNAGRNNTTGFNNSFFGSDTGLSNTMGSNNTLVGNLADFSAGSFTFATAIGAGATAFGSNGIYLGRSVDKIVVPSGRIVLSLLNGGGNVALCFNTSNGEIAGCSSSLRYKTNIAPFNFGLNLVNRLKPITFDWKDGGMHDLGLGAEDVAAIEPLLVTYNKVGQIEGVKYDRIGVVLLNAVKEQQAQIEAQAKQINEQKLLIDGLKTLVCTSNSTAAVCQ